MPPFLHTGGSSNGWCYDARTVVDPLPPRRIERRVVKRACSPEYSYLTSYATRTGAKTASARAAAGFSLSRSLPYPSHGAYSLPLLRFHGRCVRPPLGHAVRRARLLTPPGGNLCLRAGRPSTPSRKARGTDGDSSSCEHPTPQEPRLEDSSRIHRCPLECLPTGAGTHCPLDFPLDSAPVYYRGYRPSFNRTLRLASTAAASTAECAPSPVLA
jgi:hypothetical protein